MKSNKQSRALGCLSLLGVFLIAALWSLFAFTAPPIVTFPVVTLPKPNAFDTHFAATLAHNTKAQDLEKMFGLKPNTRLSFEQTMQSHRTHRTKVEAWLKSNAAARKEFRLALTQEYLEPPQRGTTIGSSKQYAAMREMARIIMVESSALAARGDWTGAKNSALDIVDYGHDIQRGAPLIGALVGYAVQAVGRRQLQELLPNLDAAQCRDAALKMEKLRANRVPFATVLQEEKWVMASNMLPLLQGGQGIGLQCYGFNPKTKTPCFRPVSRRRLMSDFQAYMDALSASANLPYSQAVVPPPPGDFLTSTFGPVLARGRYNAARSDTTAALLLLALALRAYRLENGAYPETLAPLVPQYISQVPPDGFGGGEQLRYKKTGDKFQLWSIGPDKTDNGGKPATNPAKAGKPGQFLVEEKSRGDFVFGVSR